MTKENVIEILERFVIGAKPCSQSEIVDACASAYRMLKKQPSLPSNLDEAAEDFVWEVMENDEEGISELSKKLRPTSKISDFYDALGEFFKAGAKWMTEQGETKEGIVVDNNDFIDFEDNSFIDVCPTLDKKAFNLHDGEKVIVQIRKKED